MQHLPRSNRYRPDHPSQESLPQQSSLSLEQHQVVSAHLFHTFLLQVSDKSIRDLLGMSLDQVHNELHYH